MSTLILQAAGSSFGGAIGGPLGALAGQTLGALGGAAIDAALFGSSPAAKLVEGPRLKTLGGLSSTPGAPIPRVYGRVRLGGEIIWATRFQELVSTQRSGAAGRSGGKGGGSNTRGRTQETVTTTYSYVANLAVALCEGPIAFVRRVWADGRELDLTGLVMRVHVGDETQAPDPLIVAKEGVDRSPAYRGVAYVVFERLPLGDFGNRVPQLAFEIVRPVGGLARSIRAVNLVPGAGEFVYAPDLVTRAAGDGQTTAENRHLLTHPSDWAASLDALQGLCPKLESVGLVVTWFGDDLRAGRCSVAPRVESLDRSHQQAEWSVAGLLRAQARPVSRVDDRPAYGGSPSDASVIAAIRDLKRRGLAVMLSPFVMMDVPGENALPDPWTGGSRQAAYPWRGRITVDPAPGRPGSPDATAAAAVQIAALFGSASPAHFAVVNGAVSYSGPPEWSLRRQILHYAYLAVAAGGVDTFVIGSELVGLTRVRSASGVYPAVSQLVALAADVRGVVGPSTRITYAADWTEYGAHVPQPGELRFPLDPLWASPAIDEVGLDLWWPMGDWRDGPLHADSGSARGPHDPAYLAAQVAGGEAFDWFYADEAARNAQQRSPITDGAHGKPWVFRPKDLVGWWSNPHVERVGGVELATPTPWVPRGKPIRVVELGCPAVDKGGNGPNAFPDPKSSEGGLPPFSRGTRDDLIQARTVSATLAHFADTAQDADARNPVSPAYGGRMVDPARMHVWAWDARPFPAFPAQSAVWADATAWDGGHWLTGRLEGAPLDDLVAAILGDRGSPPPAELSLDGFVDGYVVDRPMGARAALEPLARLCGFDAAATGGALAFLGRQNRTVLDLDLDDVVPGKDGERARLTRAQEAELPASLQLSFVDADGDYERASVASRRLAGASRRQVQIEVPAVLPQAEALRLAETALFDSWAGRETAEFALRPGLVALEVGDLVRLPPELGQGLFRVTRIRDALAREITARSVDPAVFGLASRAVPRRTAAAPAIPGQPFATLLDLPLQTGEPPVLQSLAVTANPWPGRMAVWRSADGSSFDPLTVVDAPATVGRLLGALPPGPLWRWDDRAAVEIRLSSGALGTSSDLEALAGGAALAIQRPDGSCEVIAFARAVLTAERTWRLSRLLRGLGGSEAAAATSAPEGSVAVLLDAALAPIATGVSSLGQSWRLRVGPADRDVADPSMTELVATAGTAALRPLAPVRARARRTAAGVIVTWLRRGRVDADGWEPLDIPLGENGERYEADVLAGAGVVRSYGCSTPELVYPAADEIADFGAPQAALSLRIHQMSAVVGRGAALSITLPVD